MGCANQPASEISAEPLQRGTNVALLFSSNGMFVVRDDGSAEKVNNESWGQVSCALPSKDSKQAFAFHSRAIYTIPLAGGPYTALKKADWFLSRAVVRPIAEPDSMIVFHSKGSFKVNMLDGSSSALMPYMQGNHGWAMSTCAVYNPGEPECAYIFHLEGVFRVMLNDGSSQCLAAGGKQRSDGGWHLAKAAVWDRERGAAIVFHSNGLYRVKLSAAWDGTYEKLSFKSWKEVRGAFNGIDGKAVVIDAEGIFQVDMGNGLSTKVNSDSWRTVDAVCPLGDMILNSSAAVPLTGAEDVMACKDSRTGGPDPTELPGYRGTGGAPAGAI